mmetsp:Transcript_44838/g.116110  ORF Transcript_44838/g.116110 Transcript_44838/m.116110 type:complete len:210 (-) Transcript_44838:64-693(-)
MVEGAGVAARGPGDPRRRLAVQRRDRPHIPRRRAPAEGRAARAYLRPGAGVHPDADSAARLGDGGRLEGWWPAIPHPVPRPTLAGGLPVPQRRCGRDHTCWARARQRGGPFARGRRRRRAGRPCDGEAGRYQQDAGDHRGTRQGRQRPRGRGPRRRWGRRRRQDLRLGDDRRGSRGWSCLFQAGARRGWTCQAATRGPAYDVLIQAWCA